MRGLVRNAVVCGFMVIMCGVAVHYLRLGTIITGRRRVIVRRRIVIKSSN